MTGKLLEIVQSESNNNDVCLPGSTRFLLEGVELTGVRCVDVRYRPDEIVTAEIQLFPGIHRSKGIAPKVVMEDPFTGEIVEVVAIELADGTRREF